MADYGFAEGSERVIDGYLNHSGPPNLGGLGYQVIKPEGSRVVVSHIKDDMFNLATFLKDERGREYTRVCVAVAFKDIPWRLKSLVADIR